MRSLVLGCRGPARSDCQAFKNCVYCARGLNCLLLVLILAAALRGLRIAKGTRMRRIQTFVMAAALAVGLGAGQVPAQDVMVVYDASGSMWGQIEGVTKIEIAREVLGDLVNQWPDETNLGLVAYGHRRLVINQSNSLIQ